MSAAVMRSGVHQKILRARRITDALFDEVLPDAMYDRPIPERHRMLFYAGHLEAFDWNQIGRHALGLRPVSEELDRLFAFGIDPPPGQLPQDEPRDWPTLEQTGAYIRKTRERLEQEMRNAPDDSLHIALEHRLMHAETITYLLHNLPYGRRRVTARAPIAPAVESPSTRMLEIPAGIATLGRERGGGFGWDNEFEQNTRHVPAFRVAKHKVTNGDYLKFVKDGGSPPHYWTERSAQWFYRGTYAEMPLPADWPVYVSHAQAQSYAQWLGKALPTEAQFHRAAYGSPECEERRFPWRHQLPGTEHGNFDFRYADLLPVTATPAGDSAFGVSQLVGNGWEWTSSVFEPFPGFEPDPSYPGYSADFFDGDHYVLKGGSCATDALLLRSSFRNWFRHRYPYAYTTFRLVEN
jgi:gamma-glutamyl hercynylcysteine S-oxide synthase